jgi:hypothetical protein
MIPALVKIKGAPVGIKYLPVGIHKATIDEVESTYAYNIFRKEIFEGLKLLITDLKKIGCNTIYINGSFVTSIKKPNDVDVCWEESSGTGLTFEKQTLPILWNREEAKNRYKADIFLAQSIEFKSKLTFLKFFQRIKYTNLTKGIIQLDIY